MALAGKPRDEPFWVTSRPKSYVKRLFHEQKTMKLMQHNGIALWLALGLAGTSQAADLVNQDPSSTRQGKAWDASVTTSVSETPVNPESADHFRSYSVGAGFGYQMMKLESKFLKDPKLKIDLSYSDEIGYEDNESNLDNTPLTFSGLGVQLTDEQSIKMGVIYVLPTKTDDRDYLSYRGSLILKPGYAYEFAKGTAKGLTLGTTLILNKSFYEYDTSVGREYNPEQSYSLVPYIMYSMSDFTATASFSNSTTYLSDGSQLDDRYATSLAVSYQATNALSLDIEWSKRDRTFGYNGTRPNVNFAYADLTLLTISGTYSL